jgi:5-methylcytosine-specific restriction endonuclease McrA
MNQEQLENRYKQYREYKAQGHSHKEVAEHFGISEATSQKACKGIAKQKPDYDSMPWLHMKPSEDYAREMVEKNLFGFIYIGNYTGSSGTVDILCCVCNEAFTQAFTTIRQGKKVTCPNCQRSEAEERERKREQQKEQRIKEIEERKYQREQEHAARIKAREHPCIACGEITTRPKYCSDSCLKKAMDSAKDVRRRHKIQTALVDTGISALGLYKRDNGVCYLCGQLCNLDDYVVRDGHFIAGDWYPSVDHVVPLSKGGLHSWENVKLAHRICNSIKADSPLVEKNC